MNLKKVLLRYKFPQDFIENFAKNGISELYPPQAEAIKKGVLDGNNLLMSVPTAAGKTLIAELALARWTIQEQGRCLYIAPLKALASEKFQDFKEKLSPFGINVGLAIGDADSPHKKLSKYHILVATAEKVDSLLRSKTPWLINSLNLVVLDEIHFINDGERGPTMEILAARIKQLNPKLQTIALSATVSNAEEMARWLNAELVVSDWRPIPLKEGVYFNERIQFDGYPAKEIMEESRDDVCKLVLDTLRGRGQVLIFVSSRRSTQAVARNISASVAKTLTPEEKTQLKALSKKIAARADATKICRKLAEAIQHGAAFHHAGLKANQRELIETNFKKNLIKAISCTPTLAAGVNLPARRAIIRDCKRFESGIGAAYIPTAEYKQCAGRAGRPQYDEYGEAVLLAKSHSDSETLFERYIEADPEPIISKLAKEAALRIHILASIAGGYIHDIKGMFAFIQHTFLYHQKQSSNILDTISQVFEFLQEEGFIQKSGYRFFATPFGSLTSRLYIDPLSAIDIRDGLDMIDAKHPFTPIGVLHLMCCTPDGPLLNVGSKETGDIETFASHFKDDFLLTSDNFNILDDFYTYLATLKTTWFLHEWIDEEKDEVICDQFNMGPGDIYRHVDAVQWLLYAAGCIAELQRKKKLTFQLEGLRKQVRYGVREDLLEIVNIRGVGRIRARQLYKKGFRTFKSLQRTNETELSGIPTIGKSLAKDIMKQVLSKNKSRSRMKAF